MKRITDAQRRARLARRHHLAPTTRARDPVTVARDLVALHATDPTTVHLSAALRTTAGTVAPMEQALYDDRSLVRMLGMRRTMWVMPLDLVPVVHAAVATTLERNQRRLLVKLVEEGGIVDDGAAWTRTMERAALRELRRRGEASANQLTKAVPGLDAKVSYGEGKSWAGTVGVSNRVLIVLGTAGKVVRGRPRGTWVSSQYSWVPTESWLGAPIATMPADAARVELVRRWLRAFGPGTRTDLQWWTGLGKREVERALVAVAPVEVELDGGATGLVLADDLASSRAPGAWVALLPALDPTVMGWKERDWYLGDHGPQLFDTNGNAGPTVWSDGRVIGGWAQRAGGEVVVHLLEDAGRDVAAAVDAAAARLGEWLGSARVIPRFPSPLHRTLAT
jgi:hypothetical protein